MDYAKLTKDQLRNLIENARRQSREDIATEALQELTRRGGGKRSDYALLRWNQDTARTALEPFVQISQGVSDNQRTTYTEAGGGAPTRRSRMDVDRQLLGHQDAEDQRGDRLLRPSPRRRRLFSALRKSSG
jgi:hypothetical protein